MKVYIYVCMGLLVLLGSCAETSDSGISSDPMAYMPSSPDFAMQIDFKKIDDKIDLKALVDHETFQALTTSGERGAMKYMDVLMMDGLDRTKNAILFFDEADAVHVVAALADPEAFAFRVETDGAEVKSSGQFKYAYLNDHTVVWTDQLMHYLGEHVAEDDLPAKAFPSRTVSETGDPEFAKFMKTEADTKVWLNSDNLNDLLNLTGKIFTGLDGMDAGVLVNTAPGSVDIDINFFNIDEEQRAMFEELFSAKPSLQTVVYDGAPAWINMVVGEKLAAETEGLLGDLMVNEAREMLLVFEGIELSFDGGVSIKPKMSFRMEAKELQTATDMLKGLRDNGAVRSGGKINLMGYGAQYKSSGTILTGSVTGGVDLSKMPSNAVVVDPSIRDKFMSSPLKIYVDANALATNTSISQLSELEYIAIYLTQENNSFHLSLHAESDDPEKSGFDELVRVLMDVYPVLVNFGIIN